MSGQDIFLGTVPGLEPALADEAAEIGLAAPRIVDGGVEVGGGVEAVMRANLHLRSAGQVLWRVARFRALHLAQLDKRARKIDWHALIRPGTRWRVEAACRQSRIYHDRAARDRIVGAVADALGTGPDAAAALRILLRIEDDLAVISLDTSGAPLHKRGHKPAVGKAPLRETMAAGFLRQCGFSGAEPVFDPMCGSGTFVLEAAEIALGLLPGRSRRFAFEGLVGFDADALAEMRRSPARETALRFVGHDRDDGAIRMATANAEAAGLAAATRFDRQAVSASEPPDGPPGLVMVNPPYGGRIGNRKLLFALYGSLGAVLKARFAGWRVGLVTADGGLARACGLPFLPPGPPIPHGGLTVRLYRTDAL